MDKLEESRMREFRENYHLFESPAEKQMREAFGGLQKSQMGERGAGWGLEGIVKMSLGAEAHHRYSEYCKEKNREYSQEDFKDVLSFINNSVRIKDGKDLMNFFGLDTLEKEVNSNRLIESPEANLDSEVIADKD